MKDKQTHTIVPTHLTVELPLRHSFTSWPVTYENSLLFQTNRILKRAFIFLLFKKFCSIFGEFPF